MTEASWDSAELELGMNADVVIACSRYPNNPKLRRLVFFVLGGTGIPPSTGGPDGAVTAKISGEEGKGTIC